MDNRLVELYVNKFLKGKLDFRGINLIPEIFEENGTSKISWTIENPKDISYTYFAAKGFIEDSLEEFFELIGDPLHGTPNRRSLIRQNYINTDSTFEDLYVSSKMQKSIEEKLREEIIVGFGNYQMKIKGFDYYITTYHEEITFEMSVIIHEMFKKNTNQPMTKEEISKFLTQTFEGGDESDLYDTITWHVVSQIYQCKTIYDENESYIRDIVTFFDEDKNIIDFNWG